MNSDHHPCSVNFYVLLTDVVEANSSSILFLESAPNSQDWHHILGKYGKVHYFTGALSTHWTTDSNTDTTCISLDFRVIPGTFYDAMKRGGRHRNKQGYYRSCCKVGVNGEMTWVRPGPVYSPLGDPRFGYPWTNSKKRI